MSIYILNSTNETKHKVMCVIACCHFCDQRTRLSEIVYLVYVAENNLLKQEGR
jgi:hypothetical protein